MAGRAPLSAQPGGHARALQRRPACATRSTRRCRCSARRPAAAIKPLLERDPTGEAAAHRRRRCIPASAPRSDDGVWVSRNGAARRAAGAVTRAAGADLDAQAARHRSRARGFRAARRAGGLRLQLSGRRRVRGATAARASSARRRGWRSAGTVLPWAGCCCWRSRRCARSRWRCCRWPPAWSPASPRSALAFGSVHGITLGFGSTLIGEAVDYAIYYLIQARGAAVPGTGWQRWRERQLAAPCGSGCSRRCAALPRWCSPAFRVWRSSVVFSIAGLVARRAGHALRAAGAGARRRARRRACAGTWRSGPATACACCRGCAWLWLLLGAAAACALLAARWTHLWRADLASLSPVVARGASARCELARRPRRQRRAHAGGRRWRRCAGARCARPKPRARGSMRWSSSGAIAGYDSPARAAAEPGHAAGAAAPACPMRRRCARDLAQATADGPLKAARLEPFIDEVAGRARARAGRARARSTAAR